MRIAIIGTGGMARELLAPLRSQWQGQIVFADRERGPSVYGLQVISDDDLGPRDHYVIGIGDSKARQRVDERLTARGARPVDLRARTAITGPEVHIGPGGVLCDFTIITASVKIGRQFQCNVYAHVSHDCVIGDYVTLAPKVCINGNVHIEDYAWIGAGAIIKNGVPGRPIVIGRGAIVGCGAVVVRDVAPGATVMGVPAR